MQIISLSNSQKLAVEKKENETASHWLQEAKSSSTKSNKKEFIRKKVFRICQSFNEWIRKQIQQIQQATS